jgi:hypothetical protein
MKFIYPQEGSLDLPYFRITTHPAAEDETGSYFNYNGGFLINFLDRENTGSHGCPGRPGVF